MERLCPLVDSSRDAIRDELAFGGILRAFLPALLHLLKLGKHKLRVLSHLAVCGTPALGANLFDCPHCRHRHWVPRSCGNRHCPRRFSLHILPSGLVRIRHYGILGNNRRKRDIESARAILQRRGRALELESPSVADKPMCCPLCGKAGIRLVAFTDAMGVLHMSRTRQILCDSS
jgi:hypothetical protein